MNTSKGEVMATNTFDKTRIENAVGIAQDAFWYAIADAFPEIETGDYPPLDTVLLDKVLLDAVNLWLDLNEGQKLHHD
jgi:hypothetical protein